MPIIPAQDRTPKVDLKTKIRQDTKELLNAYVKYTTYDQDYVVEQLLLTAIRADKDFKKTSQGAGTLAKPKNPKTKEAAA